MWPLTKSLKNYAGVLVGVAPHSAWGTPKIGRVISAFKKYGPAESSKDSDEISWIFRDRLYIEEGYVFGMARPEVTQKELEEFLSEKFGNTCYVVVFTRGAFAYNQETSRWEDWAGKALCPTCKVVRKLVVHGSGNHMCKNCGDRFEENQFKTPPSYQFQTIQEVRKYVSSIQKQATAASR